jgi:hypothetical protein
VAPKQTSRSLPAALDNPGEATPVRQPGEPPLDVYDASTGTGKLVGTSGTEFYG